MPQLTLGRWGGSREDDPSEAEAKKKSLIEALNFPPFPTELEQVRGSCRAADNMRYRIEGSS